MLWPAAAKKGWTGYRRVAEAAECFMTRWHGDEGETSWLRHATEDAKSDHIGKWGGKEGQPYWYCCRRMQIMWQGTGSTAKYRQLASDLRCACLFPYIASYFFS